MLRVQTLSSFWGTTTMTDRELLELAATAAGMKARWFKVKKWRQYPTCKILCGHNDVFGTHHSKPWNPLTDDGDALRLATDLDLNVFHAAGACYAMPSDDDGSIEICVSYRDAGDKHTATRLAITRAAAEIGREML